MMGKYLDVLWMEDRKQGKAHLYLLHIGRRVGVKSSRSARATE